MAIATFFYLLALAIWLGAMVGAGLLVPSTAFKVLPTRELAGTMVNAVLSRFYPLTYVCGTLMLVTLTVMKWKGVAVGLRATLVAVMLGLSVLSGVFVAGKMAQIRQELGVIDQVPKNDPVRAEFNRWHKLSEGLMVLVLVGAIALVALEARRLA